MTDIIQLQTFVEVNMSFYLPVKCRSIKTHKTEDLYIGQYEEHHVIIPLLINQCNISLDVSLWLSKRLADSDLAVKHCGDDNINMANLQIQPAVKPSVKLAAKLIHIPK
jgi:hypothetical protein